MQELIAALGAKKSAIFAGGLGAVLAFKFFRKLSWPDRVITAVLSMPLALIGGGAAAESFELGPRTELLVTVLIASGGIAVLAAMFDALPQWLEAARKKYLGS